MYAIVKTGGKQYRVEQGQSLLVERLPVEDGAKATLRPLLYVDGENVVDGEGLAKVSVEARVVGHERGPKLRVVKFKPKRGYKRRTGHRQELTRIEVTQIKLAERRPRGARTEKPADAEAEAPAKPAPRRASTRAGAAKPARSRAGARPEGSDAPAKPARPRGKPPAKKPRSEDGDGA